MARALVRLIAVAVAVAVAGCGGDDDPAPADGGASLISEAGAQHVHGLGVDAADGALYIATHSGLWRAPDGEAQARRVGDLRHDLMGFTVAGAEEYLASGHPDPREGLPPLLGLQRSTDGGRSWQPVSLEGEADLHVLRTSGDRIYAADAGTGAFLTSEDAGASWEQRSPPAAVFDVAVAPGKPDELVAATEKGLWISRDTGRRWRPLKGDVLGLLAWPATDALYLVDGQGRVSRSADGGRTFEPAGSLGSQPEAFAAAGPRELYAAVHGGEVRASDDGGATWRLRARPAAE